MGLSEDEDYFDESVNCLEVFVVEVFIKVVILFSMVDGFVDCLFCKDEKVFFGDNVLLLV